MPEIGCDLEPRAFDLSCYRNRRAAIDRNGLEGHIGKGHHARDGHHHGVACLAALSQLDFALGFSGSASLISSRNSSVIA